MLFLVYEKAKTITGIEIKIICYTSKGPYRSLVSCPAPKGGEIVVCGEEGKRLLVTKCCSGKRKRRNLEMKERKIHQVYNICFVGLQFYSF